jgi:hypothetical protein
MTQTPIAPATRTVAAPVTAEQLRRAAFDGADITTPDGTLVYPGVKLLWFGENTCDGDWDFAATLMNGKALMTGTPFFSTVPQVRAVLEIIRKAAGAGLFEQATRMEQKLWEGSLEAVASGNAQAGYIAAEALDSKKIDFPRQSL